MTYEEALRLSQGGQAAQWPPPTVAPAQSQGMSYEEALKMSQPQAAEEPSVQGQGPISYEQALQMAEVPRAPPSEQSGYVGEAAKAIGRGATATAGSILMGAGAQAQRMEPILGQQLSESVLGAALRGTVPEVIQGPGGEVRDVREQPLYRAGEAVQKFGERAMPDTGALPELARDVFQGVGSVVTNIAPVLIPGLGLPMSVAGGMLQGTGEAAQRAVQKGATPQQQASASGFGTMAGATEFADVLLLSTGSIGKALNVVSKIGQRGLAALGGAFMEGGQEATQALLQNWIAQGVYDPEQSIGEGVGYAALVGAIVGGGVSGVLAKPETKRTPASEEKIDEQLRVLKGEPTQDHPVPSPPPGPSPNVTAAQTGVEQAVVPVEPQKVGSPSQIATPYPSEGSEFFKQQAAEWPVKAKEDIESSDVSMDPEQVIALLGGARYAHMREQAKVALKELYQNAVDSVRPLLDSGQEIEGNVDIVMHDQTRTIEILDDGHGMTPEVMSGKFLQLGGTVKESGVGRAGGGFGVAKAVTLYEAETVDVRSMRGGMVYEMSTTGRKIKEWAVDPRNPKKKIIVKPRPSTGADRRQFPKGHGTAVKITVPKTFFNPETNMQEPIQFNSGLWAHDAIVNSPLYMNVNTKFNGQQVETGKAFPADKFAPLFTVDFGWGDARVYAGRNPEQYGLAYVLSRGLLQFHKGVPKDPAKPFEGYVNRQFFVDIAPKVGPRDPGYPFDLNRQQFTQRGEKDWNTLASYVATLYQLEEFQNDIKNFGDVQTLSQMGSLDAEGRPTGRMGVFATKSMKLEPKVAPQDSPLMDMLRSGKITIVDGELMVGGKGGRKVSRKDLENFRIDFSALTIDQSEIDPEAILLHDNVNVKISELETRSMVELGREKFGNRFNDYMFDIGMLFKEVRRVVFEMKTKGPDRKPFGGKSVTGLLGFRRAEPELDVLEQRRQRKAEEDALKYEGLDRTAIGVSFDISYNGVSISIPMRGQFINPGPTKYPGQPERQATRMFTTMVHEIAHYPEMNHEAGWREELQNTWAELIANPEWNAIDFLNRLATTIKRNQDIADHLAGVYSGLYPLSARGKRFQDVSEQTSLGVLPRDRAGPSALREAIDGDQGAVGGPSPPVGQQPGPPDVPPGAQPSAGPSGGAPTTGAPGAKPGTRASGTSPRQLGLSPRQLGESPRQLGVSPRQLRRKQPDSNVATSEGPGSSPDNGLAANQRALDQTGNSEVPAVPQQPEHRGIRGALGKLFEPVGGMPAPVREAAGHADRMNWGYKFLAGIIELGRANPHFRPLTRYVERMFHMHSDEAEIHDVAMQISKDWRRLGEEGEDLSRFVRDLTLMTYRSKDEVDAGLGRHPSSAEFRELVRKHKLSDNALKVFHKLRLSVDSFIDKVAASAIDKANRTPITGLDTSAKILARVEKIQNEVKALKSRPYFPFMRFGDHYLKVKGPDGQLELFETFERQGRRSAVSLQREAEAIAQKDYRTRHGVEAPPGAITTGVLPEHTTTLVGLPKMLLEDMLSMQMTPGQLTNRVDLMAAAALGLEPILKPSVQRKYYVPSYSVYTKGYSMDMRRAYSKYMFHGAKYYARNKHEDFLREDIAEAERAPGNKEGAIARYMKDHLYKTVLDARGDFGAFKGGIFLWTMGYVVSSATQNMSQIAMISYPWLASRFGGIGIGDITSQRALLKAMGDLVNTYKGKRTLTDPSKLMSADFKFKALSYGVKTGRISETQASELAGLSQGAGLLHGFGGTALQNRTIAFMEKAAWMFEMAEQFNRRITWRAAIDLALRSPNARGVKEALNHNKAEYEHLVNVEGFSPQQAAAIVTAAYAVESTQYVYSRYARARVMRGPLPGTILVFQNYLRATGVLLAQNWKDVLPRYLLISMLIGGLGGIPFAEDLKDVIKALSKWRFGEGFNIEKEARKYVLDLFGGAVEPDLVLHGMARRGFGIPALLDLLGSMYTGVPGRGLAAPRHDEEGKPQGFARNIPLPVTDRSRAFSLNLPVNVGMMFEPTADVNRTISQSVQKASGAVFSVGFNIFKATHETLTHGFDPKNWEKAVPRMLGETSQLFRTYNEGRERLRGGEYGGQTVIRYDPNDTEQMMEMIAQFIGYNIVRRQARVDAMIAKIEQEKYYELRQKGLLSQFYEAHKSGREASIESVRELIRTYNEELPEWARGMAIKADTVRKSIEARERTNQMREMGLSPQRRFVPMAREVDRLYPEATIDVRPVQ